jgi:hypothetical protein
MRRGHAAFGTTLNQMTYGVGSQSPDAVFVGLRKSRIRRAL